MYIITLLYEINIKIGCNIIIASIQNAYKAPYQYKNTDRQILNNIIHTTLFTNEKEANNSTIHANYILGAVNNEQKRVQMP